MGKNRFITLLIAVAAITPTFSFAKTINVAVKGIVCSFCAQGISKTFKKEASIKDIKVDLDKKIVKLETNEGKDITDEAITEKITEAGYNVVKISRE